MNNARLATSERLQRLLALLQDGQWHTTLDLSIHARTVCASTGISELRANGLNIESEKRGGNWQYRLPFTTMSHIAPGPGI